MENKFFSIEQAGNWLREFAHGLKDKMRKAVSKDAQISVAPPKDRYRFLAYGISFLKRVDSEEEDLFYTVTGKSRNLYSNSELADFLRKILLLRASGYSAEQIAFLIKMDLEILKKVEIIAIASCNKEIEKVKLGGIPLVGGLN